MVKSTKQIKQSEAMKRKWAERKANINKKILQYNQNNITTNCDLIPQNTPDADNVVPNETGTTILSNCSAEPSGELTQRELCVACGKPIHINDLAGITKEGMYHNNLICLSQLWTLPNLSPQNKSQNTAVLSDDKVGLTPMVNEGYKTAEIYTDNEIEKQANQSSTLHYAIIKAIALARQSERNRILKEIKPQMGYMAEVICALNKFKYECYAQVNEGISMDWLMQNAPCNINDSTILCNVLKKYYPEIYQESGKSIKQMEAELKSIIKEESK